MGTKHVTCRYFLHGVCREGSNCHFSHDVHNSSPSLICKYYQRGACVYGDRCRYDHVKALPRRGGATGEVLTATGGGASAAGGGAKRGLVLTDTAALRAPGPASGAPHYSSTAPAQAPGAPRYSSAAPAQAPGAPRYNSAASAQAPGAPRYGSAAPAQAPGAPRYSSAAPPMFYPPQSYVEATRTGLDQPSVAPDSTQLCPYLVMGQCHYGDQCEYLHGDQCEVCGLHLLHPHDPEQRREHEKLCLTEFEAEMEKAFAAQISQDKVCSICMEVVVQKLSQSERRFGILSSCDHCFCLGCIRKWRHAPFSNDVIKACPECRVPSELVVPSVHWVQDQQQKDQLVALFKTAVSKKPCKFFSEGRGTCPFGDRCLYLHCDPFGRKPGPERVRKQLGPEGNVRFMNSVRLWDFIEEREHRSAPPPDRDVTDDVTFRPDDLTSDLSATQEEEVSELSRNLQQLSASKT